MKSEVIIRHSISLKLQKLTFSIENAKYKLKNLISGKFRVQSSSISVCHARLNKSFEMQLCMVKSGIKQPS